MVMDLLHIVRALQVQHPQYKQFVFLGILLLYIYFTTLAHSMGGALSLSFASLFPAWVQAIILLDSLGRFTIDAKQYVPALQMAMNKHASSRKRANRAFDTLQEAAYYLHKSYKHGLSVQGATHLVQYGTTYDAHSNKYTFSCMFFLVVVVTLYR